MVHFTDHAIRRYFERVHGIDTRAIEKSILTNDVLIAVKELGDCEIQTEIEGEIFSLVIRKSKVVTIHPVKTDRGKGKPRAWRGREDVT